MTTRFPASVSMVNVMRCPMKVGMAIVLVSAPVVTITIVPEPVTGIAPLTTSAMAVASLLALATMSCQAVAPSVLVAMVPSSNSAREPWGAVMTVLTAARFAAWMIRAPVETSAAPWPVAPKP